jgi:hypothetical protein
MCNEIRDCKFMGIKVQFKGLAKNKLKKQLRLLQMPTITSKRLPAGVSASKMVSCNRARSSPRFTPLLASRPRSGPAPSRLSPPYVLYVFQKI